jgi:hypothetical protein
MPKPFRSNLLIGRKQARMTEPQAQSPIKLELDADDSVDWYLDLIAECVTILREKLRNESKV